MSLTVMKPIFPMSLKSSSHPTRLTFFPMWSLLSVEENILSLMSTCCMVLLSCNLYNKFYFSYGVHNSFYFQDSDRKEEIFKKPSYRAICFDKPYFSFKFFFN